MIGEESAEAAVKAAEEAEAARKILKQALDSMPQEAAKLAAKQKNK